MKLTDMPTWYQQDFHDVCVRQLREDYEKQDAGKVYVTHIPHVGCMCPLCSRAYR